VCFSGRHSTLQTDALKELQHVDAISAPSVCRTTEEAYHHSNSVITVSVSRALPETYTACIHVVNLVKCCQPPLLSGWMPVAIETDGNCLFRSLSFAVFHSEKWHLQLRLLACMEIDVNDHYYSSDSEQCNGIFRRSDIIVPSSLELLHEAASSGSACCIGALVALRSVLKVRIHSYYPPLQATFVASHTVDILGREVDATMHSVAVVWSTSSTALATGAVNINHVVPLVHRPLSVPVDAEINTSSSTDDVAGTFLDLCNDSHVYYSIQK